MKIANITPGILPIPPNGWGAVEKIIWEMHNNFIDLNQYSSIKYLDEISDNHYDIIHIHVANLALLAHERNIPYYFTMHDHHSYLYGKNSSLYKENLLAMKYSIKSFVPAKFLVEYFDNIPTYFSHGVNTTTFTPSDASTITNSLLCVANNGFIDNPSEDRKGFEFAINVAIKLNMPITIAGPNNNRNFFNKLNPTYDKLTILYDLSEQKLIDLYKQHSIFVHPSILEAGHPNLTLLEAMASGLPVVATFEKDNKLDGMEIITRDVDNIVNGINKILNNYSFYKNLAINQAKKLSWKNRALDMISKYAENSTQSDLKSIYNNTRRLAISSKQHIPNINVNFINGPFIEITGNSNQEYTAKFIDTKTNTIEYSVKMFANTWSRASRKWYTDWNIQLYSDNILIYEHKLNLENTHVYLHIDSNSLGDTLAWMPYIEKFKKDKKCKVTCSTFWNDLFKDVYTDITFVTPGSVVDNIYAMYEIGIFGDGFSDTSLNKEDTRNIPLQQVATNILGFEFEEIKPKISHSKNIKKIDGKYICIAEFGSAQSKFWNLENGWQTIVDYLVSKKYKVVSISKENTSLKNIIDLSGNFPILDRVSILKNSSGFIGISSGLSWLAWASGIQCFIISGHTKSWYEFQSNCVHIHNNEVCNGCWHTNIFDKGDWNWCPILKGTDKQFECTKKISSEYVVSEIEKFL